MKLKWKITSTVTIFLAMFYVLGWEGNWAVDVISMVKYALRGDSRYAQDERYLKEISKIEYSDCAVPKYIPMRKVTRDNLLAIENMAKRGRYFFHDRGINVDISSLATRMDSRGYFITSKMVLDENFDPVKWFEENYAKRSLRDDLLGRVKTERSENYIYTQILFIPDQEMDEKVFNQYLSLFFMGEEDYDLNWSLRELVFSFDLKNLWTWFELNLKPRYELHSSFNNFVLELDSGEVITVKADLGFPLNEENKLNGMYSWSRGRYIVTAVCALFAYLMCTIMLCLAPFFLTVLLGSWRQAFAVWLNILCCFAFARGTIGALSDFIQWANQSITGDDPISQAILWLANDYIWHSNEDVYTSVAFIVALASSVSFNFHHAKELGRSTGEYWQRWESVKSKLWMVTVVFAISIADFAVALNIRHLKGSQSIFQVSIVAISAIIISYWLCRNFLPILYYLIGGANEKIEQSQGKLSRWSRTVNNFLNRTISWIFSRWVLWRHSTKVCWSIAAVSLIFYFVLPTFFLGKQNDPEPYLSDNQQAKLHQELAKEGRPGSNIFTPTLEKIDLGDPLVIDKLVDLRNSLERDRLVVRAYSPVDDFVLRLQDFGYEEGRVVSSFLRELAIEDLLDEGIELTDLNIATRIRETLIQTWNEVWSYSKARWGESYLARRSMERPTEENSRCDFLLKVSTGEQPTPDMRNVMVFIENEVERIFSLPNRFPSGLARWVGSDRVIMKNSFLFNFLLQLVVILMAGVAFKRHFRKSDSAWTVSFLMLGVVTAVPFIVAQAGMYLAMWAFGMPMDIANTTIGPIAVTIAVDFPLLMLGWYCTLALSDETMVIISKSQLFGLVIRKKEMVNAAVDVCGDCVTNMLMFVGLCFSLAMPVAMLGRLEEMVIFLCLMATILLVSPLMRYVVTYHRGIKV